MPRIVRIKGQGYIYHIMCRSISEVALFRDNDDKNYYLDLLKKYKKKYQCKLYAYCIMDSHLHIAALIIGRLGLPSAGFIQLKYRRAAKKARPFLAFVLRALCGLSYKELCANIGNMSIAGISRLCSEGFRLYTDELQYRELFQEVISFCGKC